MNRATLRQVTPAIEFLPEVIERIVRDHRPERIVLFGSWARGDADRRSDLDLLVVLSEMPDKRAAALSLLRSLTGIPAAVDAIPTDALEIARRSGIPGDVVRSALREGRVVYERPE